MSVAHRLLPLLLLLPALACGDRDDGDDGDDESGTPTADLQWYLTCGDPVCNSYSGPFDGVDLCDSEAAGDPCSPEGQQCDPQNDCNALLLCTDSDPTQQTGGCPISRRKHKQDIRYLSPEQVQSLGTQALDLKLARWRYSWEAEGGPDHVGFIIDDVPGSPAVMADGEHVDLYGYASLAVAAAQSQQAEIALLRAELAALRAEVAALQDARTTPPAAVTAAR
jgi:hypothetical protein